MSNLYPHQQEAVDNSPDKWGLWFRMRVGKSATAINLANNRAKSCLIVSPKSVAKNWDKEIVAWSNGTTEFKVVTRDWLYRHWFELPAYQAIVIDEVHRGFANYKSQMHKALAAYIKRYSPPYIWLLSGTPFTSTSWSIYSYGKLLGKDWKWFDWDKRYFDRFKMGRRSIPKAKPGKETELQQVLRNIGTVIDLKDVVDVADDYDMCEYFDLNAEQKRHIKAIDAELSIVRYGQQHQLESGVLKSDGYSEELSFKCDKDTRLLEIIEDTDKIVVVVRYLAQIEKYRRLLRNNLHSVLVISGQEKQTATEVAEIAEKEDKCVVLVQADTTDGYSLKSFSTMVFVSMSYSFVNYDQIKFRMKNLKKKTPNTYIHFITNGDSLDLAVYSSVRSKQNFSEGLYAKTKSRS